MKESIPRSNTSHASESVSKKILRSMKNPIRNQTTIAPLRRIQRRIFVLAAVAWFCALAVSAFAQGGGQDNAISFGRQLAVPNTALSRKCITISPLGIYVGTMNAAATMGVGVEQYGLDGQFIRTWAASFGNLSGLASDADGMVYAFDVPNAKVSVFGSDGSPIRSWGSAGAGDGQFSATSGYMVHAIAVDADKNVYVSDWGNSRIQVFDQQGVFLRKFGTAGDLPGQFKAGPGAVAVSAQQEVLAYDAGVENWYHTVRFSQQGIYLSRTPQNTLNSHESFGRSGAIYGLGGERVFCTSKDGLLAVGAEYGTGSYPISSSIPGTTRLLSTGAYSVLGAASFPTYVVTRGGAFDRAGNFWAVRDKKVECLERRMRFDLHKPVKSIPQPVVLGASQPSGSQTVDIDYQVSDSDSASVSAALMAFVGGTRSFSRLVVPKTFTASTAGKLGAGVPTGVPHRVSWNAPADLAGQTFANLAFEVIAKDDRSELGVHYVVIPPDANNPTPLRISNKPVQEDDLADVWYWLLASGDSRVSLSGGSVALTAAGQSYVSGAPTPLTGTNVANVAHNGTVSTLQGRAFVYKMVNCRPVTAVEKTRALAGKYNLNSVTDNSVVSLLSE
jgi:hypothetical protein